MRWQALLLLLGPCAWAEGANSLQGKVTAESLPAIVYVTGFTDPKGKATQDAEVDQQNERFMPEFLPLVQGRSIRFTNRDVKAHNVFSNSEARKFDLGTNDPGSEVKVAFQKAGLVDVFCNIHPKMEMRVLVLPNASYAMTNDKGQYKITGIPDGKYKVFAWNPKSKPSSKELEFKAGQPRTLDLALQPAGPVSPHLNKYGKPYREKKSY